MTSFKEDEGIPTYEQIMAAGNKLAAELDACNVQLEALGDQGQLINNFDAEHIIEKFYNLFELRNLMTFTLVT